MYYLLKEEKKKEKQNKKTGMNIQRQQKYNVRESA